MRKIVVFLFLFSFIQITIAQKKKSETIKERIIANAYNADSVRAELDKMPYFTLFKDNYFIGGIPIG